jgi:hypothetical protein
MATDGTRRYVAGLRKTGAHKLKGGTIAGTAEFTPIERPNGLLLWSLNSPSNAIRETAHSRNIRGN